MFQHTHYHVDNENSPDALSTIFMLQLDDKTAIHHVLAEYQLASGNKDDKLGIGIKLLHGDVLISHSKKEVHGTTKPEKKGRIAWVFFNHKGTNNFCHSKVPSGIDQLRRVAESSQA